MSYEQHLIKIAPNINQILTGTPVLKIGDKFIVAGIGGNFIPAGQGSSTSGTDTTITVDGATSEDILNGKKAYVNGSLITGSINTLTQENFNNPSFSYSGNVVTASYNMSSSGFINTNISKSNSYTIENLESDNIKSGIQILGITGSYSVTNQKLSDGTTTISQAMQSILGA